MKTSARKPTAFSLVEVVLALGVASVCMVSIFSLIPIGLAASQSASEQTMADGIISAIASDLRGTPSTTPGSRGTLSKQFAISIPPNPVSSGTTSTLFFTSSGQPTIDTAKGRYRVIVSFLSNGTTPSKSATMTNIKVSWPATTQTTAAGSAQTFIAMDRN